MRRMRKSLRKKIVFLLLGAVLQCVVLFVCCSTTRHVTEGKYSSLLEEKDVTMANAQRLVYLTRCFIKAGECFTEENTEKKYVLSEQNPEGLETEVLGKIACADLQEGMIVNKALCCEPEMASTERECVFSDIRYAECFAAGTVVDVRIRYDNGESYCVLEKKRLLKEENGKGTCRFSLTEEEQLLISGAQYDVQVYNGATIYLVGFLEARLQRTTGSRYIPSVQIMSQLRTCSQRYEESYASWCEQRAALEERLSEYGRKKKESLW